METIGLVLIGLGCICVVLGTVGKALRIDGGTRLAVAGILFMAAGGGLVMGARGQLS